MTLPLMTGSVADVSQAIGGTPLVKLNRLSAGLSANVYCKLGYMNPGGSVKDRIALNIIEEAEKSGALKPGGTIVEATSGNTGMGLAILAAVRGYQCVFVMPDKQSEEKIKALRAVGAKVVITPTAVEPEDPRSYYSVSRRIADETPNSFYANQYHNQANPDAHYRSTGPELWRQTEGQLDAFVAGLGTGGTITGTGRYLKEQKSDIALVGADCVGSIYYDYWKTGKVIEPFSYKVEGIGEDFFPTTIDLTLIDEMFQYSDKECFETTRLLARQEGLLTGGSGGAAVRAGLDYAEKIDRPAHIVVLLPDSATRYLNKVFDDDWMREHGFLDPEMSLGTIRDLLRTKSQSVTTVDKNASVRDAVGLMKRHGISQLPVMDGHHLAGLVTESRLLDLMIENGERGLEVSVGQVLTNAYELVDPDAPMSTYQQSFSQNKVLVVWARGEVRGLVTKIDMIEYLSRHNSATSEAGY